MSEGRYPPETEPEETSQGTELALAKAISEIDSVDTDSIAGLLDANLDTPVSAVNSTTKAHDIRFMNQMARLQFDRGMDQLGFSDGLFDNFTTTDKIQNNTTLVEEGVNGYLSILQGYLLPEYDFGNFDLDLARSLTTQYTLSHAYYTGDSFDVSAQDGPRGIAFNSDGTKMFTVGTTNDNVYEYALSTPFDVTTASFSQSFDVSTQETAPHSVTFNTDGTKMFIVGLDSATVYGYALSTGFDVSTASFDQQFDVSVQDAGPRSVTFNVGGTKMYITGSASDAVHQYDLSTGFDLSTGSFTRTLDVSGEAGNIPESVEFSGDGSRMFVASSSNAAVYEYLLSTAYNISTASFRQSFDVSSEDSVPQGIEYDDAGYTLFVAGDANDNVYEYDTSNSLDLTGQLFVPTDSAFNSDGSKVFITGSNTGSVHEYTLSVEYDVSTASFAQSFDVSTQDSSPESVAFNSDGTKMFVAGNGSDSVYEYALSTGFDVSTASFTQSFDASGQDTSVSGLAFNSDGSKMFITGTVNDNVYEYALSTGFDVSTASFTQSFDVSGQDGQPLGLDFNSDGSKMFVIGDGNNNVYEYALSTGFDVSTASFTQSFDVGAEAAAPEGVAVNPAGTKMYVTDIADDRVFEYGIANSFDVGGWEPSPGGLAFGSGGSEAFFVGGAGVLQFSLSTPFDVSTASFTQSFDVSGQETDPQDVTFNSDGTKMFILGNSNDSVYEYALSTGFDVSTASFTQSFDVSGQDTSVTGLAFNSDGTKMFILGNSNDNVYEYALSTGFDVSTASFTQSFDISGQEIVPTGLAFDSVGERMFVVGDSSDSVHEYALSTDFDVSTASFTQSFDVRGQDDLPGGVEFDADGSDMFITGTSTGAIYQYTGGVRSQVPASFEQSKQLSFTPSTVVISDTSEGDLTVDYTIEDGQSNTVTVSDSEVGSQVDTSALADGNITITATLDSPSPDSGDRLREFGVYFD